MKILVVFTGGTIGSSVLDNVISTKQDNTRLLIEKYKNTDENGVDFVLAEPYYSLSENNTGKTLALLISFIYDKINEDYDGIIVTHGTDTLQYTAAALSYALGLNTKPVLLVSSNYVLTDERANGLQNFAGAVTFIKQNGGKGVFVSYQNNGKVLHIHRASRLLSHSEFSDRVYSIKNQYYGKIENNKFIKNPTYFEKADEIAPFGKIKLNKYSNHIAVIQAYTGLKYPEISKNIRAVLIKSYHSGTLCTADSSFAQFVKTLKEKNIPCFICGAEGEVIYESATALDSSYFKLLPPSAFISQYIKLWIADENSIEFKEIYCKSLGGDLLS